MYIISSFTIFFMLKLNVLNAGQELDGWDISFTPEEVTAVPGLCALISCTFTHPDKAKPISNVQWIYKNTATIFNSWTGNTQGRINLLEPDLNKNNCSIIIEDIKAEDKGLYAFRVEGTHERYTYRTKVKIIIQDKPVIEVPPLREHEQADLICSAPSPCPETPPHITWWIRKSGGNMTEMKGNITLTTSKSFYNSTLTFIPTSEHHNATVRCDVSYGANISIRRKSTIDVMYVKTVRIMGNDTVKEGDTLRLNCTADSHPASSDPVWSFNGNTDKLMNHISSGSLTITNISEQHAGEYACEVTYMNETFSTSINISVITNRNVNGINNLKGPDADEDRNMTGNELQNVNGNTTNSLKIDLNLPTILTFLMGMATSAVIFSVCLCCWASCKRAKKQQALAAAPDSKVNLETMQTNIDLTVTNEQTPLHGRFDAGLSREQVESTGGAEEREAGEEETEAAEETAEEVDYATIDYSLLKKKEPEEEQRETVNTDYAEIKRDGKKRIASQNGDNQTEMSNGGSEDQKQNEGEEELYCNSKALKGQA